MKAKKIVPRIIATSQEQVEAKAPTNTARPPRPTARVVHQTFNRIAADIDILQNCDASQSQIREATKALLNIIEGARYSLIRLTDAPGIISQAELRAFDEERDRWNQRPLHERLAVQRCPFSETQDALIERVKAGWLVESGPFQIGWNRQSKFFWIGKRSGRSNGALLRFGKTNSQPAAPRTEQPDTPTPAQLQAWFDLASDRPPAESSPAAS